MSENPSQHNKIVKRFDYKWVIVALSFLMVMVCLGFCSSPKSLFIAPVTSALEIDRGLFSINDSMRFISTAVINIFFGTLISRYGAKKLIAAGFTCLILSQLIYSFATNVFVFYLGGIFLGIGLSWTTTTMVGSIINRWCKENKGTIMGAVLAANGIGGAIAIQIVTPIIESGTFGYRVAYCTVAVILFVVCMLIMFLFKNSPSNDIDETIEAPAKKKSRGRDWTGIAYSDAVKMPYFYCSLILIFLIGLTLQSVTGVSAAHMYDMGLDPSYVGTVLSISSLALAGSKFLTGFIYDKFGFRTTINICSVSAVLVMVLLSLITNSLIGKIFAFLNVIFSSIALPLETILVPIYASEFFGEKSYNKILGIFVSVNTAGYALGAPLINIVFDKCGTYTPAFIACAVLMVGIIILMQLIISRANYYHKKAQINEK